MYSITTEHNRLLSMFTAGYVRIILAFVSFYYMPMDPAIAASTYILSGFLDAFDGYAARCLNQGTLLRLTV